MVTPLRADSLKNIDFLIGGTVVNPFNTSAKMWYATKIQLTSDPHIRNIIGCVHQIEKGPAYVAAADSIVLDLYTDNAGVPGTLVATSTVPMDSSTAKYNGTTPAIGLPRRGFADTGTMSTSLQYLYSAFTSPVAASLNDTYWVVAHTASNTPRADSGSLHQFSATLNSYTTGGGGMVGSSLGTLAALPSSTALLLGVVYDFTENTWTWGGGGSQDTSGVGDANSVLSPIDVLTSVSLAGAHSGDQHGTLFVTSTGLVYFSGDDTRGGFGNGSTSTPVTRNGPIQVPGLSNIVKVRQGGAAVSGFSSYFALDSSGNLWGWGDQSEGSLGTASSSIRTTPTIINTLVQDFDSNGNTTIVLHVNGTVEAVGENGHGELGLGNTTTPQTSWQTISVASKTIAQVAAGYECLLLRMTDGTVYAAGFNPGSAGQLGVTAGTVNSTFFALPYTNSVDIWTGVETTFSLKNDGTISGMGLNSGGDLGHGTTTASESSPQSWISPLPVGVSVSQILRTSGNGGFYAVLGTDGVVYTWGNGYMGDNSASGAHSTPASLNGLVSQVWIGGGFGEVCCGVGTLALPPATARGGWAAMIGD